MRVLFADKIADFARVHLATQGFEVRARPGLSGAQLTEAIAEFDPAILVVRSTKVTAADLAAGRSLELVLRAGAGVNTIDLAAASNAGVFVANCPGMNAVAVAELTFGLLLAIDRQLPDQVSELRAGRWNKGRFSAAEGLAGKTLGLLGMGDIGQAVARRANAFGMEVLAWSRSLTDEKAAAWGVRRYESPEDVARRSNVLSVHLALTPETRGLVGESVFRELKHGAVFLNTARAEVVDEAALLRALDEKQLWAGLDVFSGEPSGKEGPFSHPLASHPRVFGTHHVGASTEQAQRAVAEAALTTITTFRNTGRVLNCVNIAARGRATHCLVVRHRDRVGVLAGVLQVLREGGLNVQEIENVLFSGGEAASARIRVAPAPEAALVQQLRLVDHVLSVSVLPL